MPQADATLPHAAARPSTLQPVRLCGWGGGDRVEAQLLRPERVADLPPALELIRERGGAIPRGMGRSYGDAAQLTGGVVLETTRLKRFQLDAESGTVTASAGVTLAELLERLVPAGWMLPVVPGTQHVSVAGAIASDIHGKSHGADGTFGAHVEELELLTASGELRRLSSDHDDDRAFAATLGGMGLTGVIASARIRLRPVSSALLSVDCDRVEDLGQALAALDASGGRYRVAWLDLLGSRTGRGVVTRADHLPAEAAPPDHRGRATVGARATVPRWWPRGVLRPSAVRAYNEFRFRRTRRRRRGYVESIGEHMFPLDALGAWPRLYGADGFLQYQLVVPRGAERVLEVVIERLRATRVPCYLAVLKDFGEANGAPLSFPIAGWTLALDIPRSVTGLDAVLDHLDELVAQAGGRVYLSKDARMRPEALAAMYPRLEEWRAARDRLDPERLWRSDLAARTGLVGG
jgi:decaprenylphospho-beta-D-ribofuranose 2-oxidase